MGKSKRQCPICIKCFDKDSVIYKLECGHIFHRDCLKPWLEKIGNCPCCRFDLNEFYDKQNVANQMQNSNDYSQYQSIDGDDDYNYN